MAFAVAIVGAVIAAVAAGVGTWQAVEAHQRQAEEAKAVEDQKNKEAQAARESAAFAEQQHRRRISLLAGQQAAVTAAAGVSLSDGSPLNAEIDLTTQGELEALNLRRGGQIESQAREFEARLARYRADTAKGMIPFDIAGGVLSAASGATTSYANYKYPKYTQKQVFTSTTK
jgi:hypothetical protein